MGKQLSKCCSSSKDDEIDCNEQQQYPTQQLTVDWVKVNYSDFHHSDHLLTRGEL